MQPVNKHLLAQHDRNAFYHLLHTVSSRNYRIGFLSTCFLSVGGFMMMPFGSSFNINNLHITKEQLPLLFMVSGVCSLIIMPLIGKLSDKIDKFKLFAFASVWMMAIVVIYTHLSVTPLWEVMIINVLMMMGIMSRMVPSSALNTAIPDPPDRGAFMSINSSIQQIAGGVAAAFAGKIIVQKDTFSPLQHYDTLGFTMVGISCISVVLVYRVSVMVKQKLGEKKV